MKILYVTRHFNASGYRTLEKLIENSFNIIGVVVHDGSHYGTHSRLLSIRSKIHKMKCRYYGCVPIKALDSEEGLARSARIPVIRIQSIKSDDFYEKLKNLAPDIIVIGGGWHELLPERVFRYPKLGCINAHPSLLPEFRGTSITRWQILHGVRRSGSTIHYVDGDFDTGGILAQEAVSVDENIFPQQLFQKLGSLSAIMMCQLLERFQEGDCPLTLCVEHDKAFCRYYRKWEWSEDKLRINWHNPFENIHNFVRANYQESFEYLGPIFTIDEQKYFLRETAQLPLDVLGNQKECFSVPPDADPARIFVICTESGYLYLHRKGAATSLVIKQIQKYDPLYKFRRACLPSILLPLKAGQPFIPQES